VFSRMGFPLRAFYTTVAVAAFLYFIGFPLWPVALFSFLGFLGMGGLAYLKLVYRTLPRDLWSVTFE